MSTATTKKLAERSCSYCGRENPERLPNCSSCGLPLVATEPEPDPEPKKKSKVAAILLAFVFGPLGLLYASVSGAMVMFLAAVPLYLILLR
jgi:hypothetical protein